jgi:hypothetical protein
LKIVLPRIRIPNSIFLLFHITLKVLVHAIRQRKKEKEGRKEGQKEGRKGKRTSVENLCMAIYLKT